MDEFLTGDELRDGIGKILENYRARCAVAFWGRGSERLLRPDARVICNLKSGGTNPHALKKMATSQIRQCDRLHAKVYIGQDQAIVCSANASANGLGLEDSEQSSWFEAGVRIRDTKAVGEWFEEFWSDSNRVRTITEFDLLLAEEAWRQRQREKPIALTFGEFDEKADRLPLITWIGPLEWEVQPKAIEKQVGGFNKRIEELINKGFQLEDPADQEIMIGSWVLWWVPRLNGLPRVNGNLYWTRLSDIVIKGAVKLIGVKGGPNLDIILASDVFPPYPFDPREPRFVSAFRAVLTRARYKPFIEREYEGAWFAERNELFRPFWADLKAEYLSLSDKSSHV
jgi:hypothetical protein